MGSVTPEPGPCPLDCSVCGGTLSHPVRLSCQHCFCRDCVTTKKCPTCAKPIQDQGELKEDKVLVYLIESSREHTESCANCDLTAHPMYFCETCQQPLCVNCKTSTHQAKIFSTHHIVDLEECGRDRGKTTCSEHNEPFILFCLDQRKLMCIECFNGSSVEKRHNFVNVDVAHKMCLDKLKKKVNNLRNFHEELREHIEVRKRVLTELVGNYSAVASEVESKSDELVAKILEIKSELLQTIEEERLRRMEELNTQLKTMANLQLPIKLNLLSASVICSAASRIDLLHCYGDVVKGIKAILDNNLERITFSSEVLTDFEDEFMKQIEKAFGWNSVLIPAPPPPPIVPKSVTQAIAAISPVVHSRSAFDLVKSRSTSPLGSYANYICNWKTSSISSNDGPHYQNQNSRNTMIQADLTGFFGDHFRRIESPMKDMYIELAQLSKNLTEIQRDITLRRCVVRKEEMEQLMNRTELLEKKVMDHVTLIDELQPILGAGWHEQLEKIRRQQNLFKQKMKDIQCIQEYAKRARQTAWTLRPFAFYMASVIAMTDSRRSEMVELAPMEKICLEISSIEPDSQKRIEAIEKEEEAQRQAREAARIVEQQAPIRAKQNLKTTKEHKRKTSTSSSAVIVEQSRDRNPMGTPVTRSSKRRQRPNLENLNCEEVAGLMNGRSVSPRDFLTSSTMTSEDSMNSSSAPSPIDEIMGSKFSISPGSVDGLNSSNLQLAPRIQNPQITSSLVVLQNQDSLQSPVQVLPPLTPPKSPLAQISPTPVPISVIPPPPPPPPIGFIAPIHNSVDEPTSPPCQTSMMKKPKPSSSLSVDSPSYETVMAREQLLVAIKERFKKNEKEEEEKEI